MTQTKTAAVYNMFSILKSQILKLQRARLLGGSGPADDGDHTGISSVVGADQAPHSKLCLLASIMVEAKSRFLTQFYTNASCAALLESMSKFSC